MKTTDVFKWNLQAYNEGIPIICNTGGQGSSKTISILQILYLISKYKTKRITICSYALPHLKSGAISDFDKILIEEGISPDNVRNTSEWKYYIGNSIIEFVGVEGNEAKVTGPRRDILYINEVNNRIKYDVFDLANSRTHDCTFVDFNPRQQFWLHEKVIPNFRHKLIHSTFENNQYLPDRERQNILMKKENPIFLNWWKVYGLGEIGTIEGAILENWRYEQPGECQAIFDYQTHGYGLDFGFNPDPDAMVKVAIDKSRKLIYCEEKIYSINNGTQDLINQIKLFYQPKELIISESATPRTTYDLEKHFNIQPVSKTKTVADWLRELQDYEIIISEKSYNLAKELQNYVWSDKKSGTPQDANNHLIDAIRYYFMNQFKGNSIIMMGVI